MLFGLIPTAKFNNDTVEIDGLDTRRQDDQVNLDVLRVTTIDDNGDRLLTQFGIQGRSDHLAKALRQRRVAVAKRSIVEATMTKDELAALRADVKQQIDTATANNVVVA